MPDHDPMFRRVLHSGRNPRQVKQDGDRVIYSTETQGPKSLYREGDMGAIFRDAFNKKLGRDTPPVEPVKKAAPKAPKKTKAQLAQEKKQADLDRAWDAHKRAADQKRSF
ncbi:MAG: hypothetical protein RLZZ283_204 [Candidatus Parcubacteria bacterium]|jgi:hypothetical protein